MGDKREKLATVNFQTTCIKPADQGDPAPDGFPRRLGALPGTFFLVSSVPAPGLSFSLPAGGRQLMTKTTCSPTR